MIWYIVKFIGSIYLYKVKYIGNYLYKYSCSLSENINKYLLSIQLSDGK